MSIEKDWKQINKQTDEDLSDLLQPGKVQKLHSSNPLYKIKRFLLINMYWALLITGLYIFVLIKFPFWPIWLTIGLVLLFNLWGAYTAFRQYQQINLTGLTTHSLLAELEIHYTGIKNWMKLQQKVALYIYPVAASGGFMIGGMLGSDKSIEEFISKPLVIIAWLVVTALLVPCCYYLARWMFRKSFGKHLKALKKNINELKEEK